MAIDYVYFYSIEFAKRIIRYPYAHTICHIPAQSAEDYAKVAEKLPETFSFILLLVDFESVIHRMDSFGFMGHDVECVDFDDHGDSDYQEFDFSDGNDDSDE